MCPSDGSLVVGPMEPATKRFLPLKEFAASRAEVSLSYTTTMLGFGAGSILLGRMIDRKGAFATMLLATIVLLARPNGQVVLANAAAEDVLGMGRRAIEQLRLQELFADPQGAERALQGAQGGAFSALRYDAHLRRVGQDPIPVHVIVAPTDAPDEVLIELLPLEQQSRQDREERLIDQAQANHKQGQTELELARLNVRRTTGTVLAGVR